MNLKRVVRCLPEYLEITLAVRISRLRVMYFTTKGTENTEESQLLSYGFQLRVLGILRGDNCFLLSQPHPL